MNFVFVNGSPRPNGNSHFAMQQLLQGVQTNITDATTQTIQISDYTVHHCIHCDSCHTNGHHCIHKDDGNLFADTLLQADVIIFITPVYWWGICGQLKTAIDRLYSKGDTLKGNKKIGLITIGADPLDTPQYDLIRQQFQCICEYMNWDFVYHRPIQAHKKNDLQNNIPLAESLLNDWNSFLK